MKGHWLPFLATTAALALAVVAPAQDRGRRGGGSSGGGSERSAPQREKSPPRESPSRSESRERPSRTERTTPAREERRDSTPAREDRRDSSRTGGENNPGGRDRRPSSPPASTPDRSSDRTPRNDSTSTGRTERRNPFERETGGRTDRVGSSNESRGSDRSTGSNRSGGGLDRPLRDRTSRSGEVSYGTRSNGYGTARPTRYGGAPSRGTLGEQIQRTRVRSGYNVSYGGVYNGLRVGYVGYSNYWYDDNFCYPFYVFDPWAPSVRCVASPWYRYSYLPGYVNTTRVVVVNNYVTTWGSGGWSSYDYDSRDRRDERLNDAIDDLRDAFERNSTRYGDRLLPKTGQVAIYNDGRYDYSISSDDFQDMFLDGVEQSKTIRYEILEVQTRGDEVHLRARHEYKDSWDKTQVVYHTLTLRRERGDGYVIREFGTE